MLTGKMLINRVALKMNEETKLALKRLNEGYKYFRPLEFLAQYRGKPFRKVRDELKNGYMNRYLVIVGDRIESSYAVEFMKACRFN